MTQVKVGADRVIAGTGNPVVIPPYWRDLGQDSVIAAESARPTARAARSATGTGTRSRR
jgi:hypothetical protein